MNLSTQDLTVLRTGLKNMVIRECNVKNAVAGDLSDDGYLIGATEGPLRLDSLDAVEIVAAIERNFLIRVDNAGDARHILKSFSSLGDYVMANASHETITEFIAKQSHGS